MAFQGQRLSWWGDWNLQDWKMTDHQKTGGWNLQDWKMTDEVAEVEFA